MGRAVSEPCGGGGQVLTQNSIDRNGNTINFVSSACPGASNSTKRDVIDERQNICTNGGCTIACGDVASTFPYLSDCQYIADYMYSLGSASFQIASGESHQWSYNSCAFEFQNLDLITYTVCYAALGYDGMATVEECSGKTYPGGQCAGAQTAGQIYRVIAG
ncbi:hypothetical protein BJV74DRAFT_978670 [Russula compacta]|nr:hypothetical protein BJV74DRAFT_978670 [Russula compacta]